MRFGHIELFAKDVGATSRFYEAIGFERIDEQGPNIVWLKSGETELLIRPGSAPQADAYASSGAAIVVYTDDLPGAISRLVAMGCSPVDYDGDEGCPLFRDPDGRWLQIVNPRS
ncbi:MAG: VOC family protein [Armatimonadetes bacterium]|nr:VOC family protein [Armatimonadota bacterium]